MIEKLATPLLALAATPNPDGSAATKLLQLIATIFKSVAVPRNGWDSQSRHPAILILSQLWPHLDNLFNVFAKHENAVEHLCRCVKHGLKSARKHSRDMLPVLLPKLVNSFKAQPFCSYLDVASTLVSELRGETDLHPQLKAMMEELVVKAAGMLSSLEAFTEDPDLVDDFFELMRRVMDKLPEVLMQLQCLPNALQSAIVGMCIQHHDASRSLLSFFDGFLEMAIDGEHLSHLSPQVVQQWRPVVVGLLQQCGPQLVNQLFMLVNQGVYEGKLNSVAKIFRKVFALAPQAADWVGSNLQQYAFLPDAEKQHVYTKLKEAAGIQDNHGEFGKVIYDFACVCRMHHKK